MAKFGTAVAVGLSVAGGGLVIAVQTPPEVAKSNAALWIKEIAGFVPDWPASVDRALTNIGLLMIIVGLTIILITIRRRRLRLEREEALAASETQIVDAPLPLPIVPNETEKGALAELRDFFDDRIDPYIERGSQAANWTKLVGSTGRYDAYGKLYGFRYRTLPLATALADLAQRHHREFEAIGVSLAEVRSRVEGLVRPIENLYEPVWRNVRALALFKRPRLDCFPGQEADLRQCFAALVESVHALRAQLQPMLEHLPEREDD